VTPNVSLPMYNLPEMRADDARFWEALRELFVEAEAARSSREVDFTDRLPVPERIGPGAPTSTREGGKGNPWHRWVPSARLRGPRIAFLPALDTKTDTRPDTKPREINPRNSWIPWRGESLDHQSAQPPLAERLTVAGVDREVRGREHASDMRPPGSNLRNLRAHRRAEAVARKRRAYDDSG